MILCITRSTFLLMNPSPSPPSHCTVVKTTINAFGVLVRSRQRQTETKLQYLLSTFLFTSTVALLQYFEGKCRKHSARFRHVVGGENNHAGLDKHFFIIIVGAVQSTGVICFVYHVSPAKKGCCVIIMRH